MRVLLDTNVVLDVLQGRAPWHTSGQQIFRAAATRRITACVTAKELTDIHCLSRRLFRGQPQADARARDVIAGLCALFEVLDTLANDCREALSLESADYEDAVMIRTAARCGCDSIVTRDPAGFHTSPVPAVDPDRFLKMLDEGRND